jgi:hypothetical protein
MEEYLLKARKARLNAPHCQEPYDSRMNVRIAFFLKQGFSTGIVNRRMIKKFSVDGRKID